MQELQRLSGHVGQRPGAEHQVLQHARPALGRLEQQDLPGVRRVRQQFGREFAVLQLVGELHGVFQGAHQGGQSAGVRPGGRLDHQDVAGVLDVGNDALHLKGPTAHVLFLALQPDGRQPLRGVRVEQEAEFGLVRAVAPAVIDAPQGRAVPVGQVQKRFALAGCDGLHPVGDATARREAQAAANLEADALAFLLVTADPLTAARGHRRHAEQVRQRGLQGLAALLAHVAGAGVGAVMQVPALVAALGAHSGQLTRLPARRHDDLVRLVLRAVVVHDGVRPELAQRQEARARQVTVRLALRRTPARDERRDRQAREVVPRQEALGGQVAVRVEVRQFPVRQAQQAQLGVRLVVQPLGLLLQVSLAGVREDGVVQLQLRQRAAVEVTPAVARAAELLRSLPERERQPLRAEPAGGRQVDTQAVDERLGAGQRAPMNALVLEGRGEIREQRQAGRLTGHVQQVGH